MRFVVLIAAALLLGGGAPASIQPEGVGSEGAGSPAEVRFDPDLPFLLIHIDGVSSDLFQEEWDAGRLPALRAFFGDRGYIPHGVSMYPPFTSALILRVRDGLAMDEGAVIDWGVWDADEESFLGRFGVFQKYLRSMPRRSRSNILTGFPYAHHLAGAALWNLPEKVERYGQVEFYWFNTDTVGHLWGEEAQRENLRLFDRYFRGLARNLDPEVQVLIYADHGMTFGEVLDYDREVASYLEDRAVFYAYPNVYLAPGEDPGQVAQDLVRDTWQGFAFHRVGADAVEGFDPAGRRLRFEWVSPSPVAGPAPTSHPPEHPVLEGEEGRSSRSDEASGGAVDRAGARAGARIRYILPADGVDPLGYWELGYRGEALTPQEWLALTHDQEFPYAPVRILQLFDNPRVGDVVTVLNAGPKSGPWVRHGNHHGLLRSDMAVPVLVRGERLESLKGRTHLPLEELGRYLPEGGFNGLEPAREDHRAAAWTSSANLALSPRYRVRLGAEVLGAWDDGEPRRGRGWAAWDVWSGYLTRAWIGAGVARDQDGGRALLRGDVEMRVRQVGARVGVASDESTRLDLFVRAGRHLDIQLRNFQEVGVGVRY